MTSALVIQENNLSVAWGKAFLKVFHEGEIAPLVVALQDLENATSLEVAPIRHALDKALKEHSNVSSSHEVANTIFPSSLWNPHVTRHNLFERYLRIFPAIRKHSQNRNGVYFQRLIAFGCDRQMNNGVNQLEHIIETYSNGNHRRTALQAAITDPFKDHTHQRQRGFPCLQQVAFAPFGRGLLAVTGFYATQYMFERAYGNYLGLCRLGQFMAAEMGLTLSRVICIATPAKLGGPPKGSLRELEQKVRSLLQDSTSEYITYSAENACA